MLLSQPVKVAGFLLQYVGGPNSLGWEFPLSHTSLIFPKGVGSFLDSLSRLAFDNSFSFPAGVGALGKFVLLRILQPQDGEDSSQE